MRTSYGLIVNERTPSGPLRACAPFDPAARKRAPRFERFSPLRGIAVRSRVVVIVSSKRKRSFVGISSQRLGSCVYREASGALALPVTKQPLSGFFLFFPPTLLFLKGYAGTQSLLFLTKYIQGDSSTSSIYLDISNKLSS